MFKSASTIDRLRAKAPSTPKAKARKEPMNKLIASSLILGISLIGCQSTPTANPPDLNITRKEFNYSTTQTVALEVSVTAAGSAAKAAPISIYQDKTDQGLEVSNQDVGEKEVARGLTDADGRYSQSISVPADLTKLYVKVRQIGVVSELIEIPILNGTAKLSLNDQTINPLTIASRSGPGLLAPKTLPSGTTLQNLSAYSTGSNGGVPSTLASNFAVSSQTLQTINASLPEGTPLPNQPVLKNYIARGAASNLVMNQAGEVWMTFVHEGAGYKNSVGYYLYNAANPPRSVNDIKTRMILAFPNASYTNSGGGLSTGNRVQLRYYDPTQPSGQQWSNTFPAGTGVGWFLMANGWNSSGVVERGTQQTVFSDQAINYQLYKNNSGMSVDKSAQTVLLDNQTDSDGRKSMLLGIEDILRYQGGDQDFNDAVLLIQANPPSAVATSVPVRDPENPDTIRTMPIAPVNNPQAADSDGDGVTDPFDDYPNDSSKALNSYYPAKGDYGTLLYEDLWPKHGDYDFNDVVLDYNVAHVTNAQNNLVQIKAEFTVKALGGGYHNGFAFQTNLTPAQVSSVTYAWEKLGVAQPGTPPRHGAITYASNGLEAGHSKATVVVFEDGYDITPPSVATRPFYSNVVSSEPSKTPGKVTVTINLTSPISASSAGTPPYNPFIIVNRVAFQDGEFAITRSRNLEVHLPGLAPTALADTALLGTQDDTSNASQGRYYKDTNNRPWALHLPTQFTHLTEVLNEQSGWVSLGQDIRGSYLQFDPWAISSGSSSKDWFRDLPGYRAPGTLYSSTP
jgi:LruC domain-containing protein